jgi:hypothetical protein
MSVVTLLRDIGIILLGILLVFTLFSLHNFMGAGKEFIDQNSLTGGFLMFNSSGAEDSPPPPTTSTPPVTVPPPMVTDPVLTCFMEGGLTADDIEIGGAFFKGFYCPAPVEKKPVTATLENKCLGIHIGGEIDSAFCFAGPNTLQVGLSLPRQPEGVTPPLIISKNYNALILFILFLVSMVLMWREFEMRERRLHERELEKNRHLVLPSEQIDVKVITSAPLFKEIVSAEEQLLSPEEVKEIHEKLMKEEHQAIRAPPLTSDEVNEFIKSFNALGKEIADYLKEGKLDKARKRYLALFPLYTRLYHSVDETHQRELVEVIKYLHDQLNIMEKSKKIRHLIEEAYKDLDQHRVDQEQKPREKLVVLKEKETAHEILSELTREKSNVEPLDKEDVLQNIEHLREKLQDAKKDTSRGTFKNIHEELEDLERLVYGDRLEQKRKRKA